MRWTRAVVLLALAFLAHTPWPAAGATAGGCPGAQVEQEPNNNSATATPVDIWPEPFHFAGIWGSIAVPGDEDWFSFTPPAGRLWLSIDTGVGVNPYRDSVVSIFGPDGVTLIETDDDDGTGNGRDDSIESLDASLIANAVMPVAGTHYARVRAKDPAATLSGYSVLIAFSTSASVPELEPNDDPSQALNLIQPWILAGSLSSASDVDWYESGNLDDGFPFIVVDGDPERDGIGTDITLMYTGAGDTIVADSSHNGSASDPPGEGFAHTLKTGLIRITGTGPGTYALRNWYSGDLCSVPVKLQAFGIE